MGRFHIFLLAIAALAISGCASAPQREKYPYTYIGGLKLVYAYLDDNQYNRRYKLPAPMAKIKTVTIHNTAGYISAMEERDRVNNLRNNVSLSFHYAVDENKAVQLVPLNIHTWHAGDGAKGEGNLYSISIEICRSLCEGEKEQLYRRAEENAVILAAHLLDAHNLPISALRKHQDWSGKNCPHKILDENRWEEFKSKVAKKMRKKDAF